MTLLLLLGFLVLLPAAIAFLETLFLQRASTRSTFSVGAPVVYRQEEIATSPASDAYEIHPAERGEYYYYSIINYLRVTEVLRDGRIVAVARNHQRLCFWPDDARLRKARLTERLLYRLRFPHS